MDNLSILAAGGLKTRMDALDVLANNIANAGTPGFKADREFYTVYASADALENAEPELVPDVSRKWTDFSQGTLAQTGNLLDLGISGKGFFAVKSGAGMLLTRNGSFRLSPTGELQTAEGHPVSGLDGRTIRMDPREPCTIGADGTITQGSRAVGKLELVDVSEPQSLAKEASGYFRLSDIASMRKAAAGSSIQQGRLEGSNISPAEAAVRLVSVLRQFEMLQRAASIGAEMNRHAVEEVARVSS